MKNLLIAFYICLFGLLASVQAQGAYKWLAVGNLHNWFSEFGCEAEEGQGFAQQQNGLQWPAIYEFQDNQAGKGFWIGATNFTDENGTNFPARVVHVGPRVLGFNEFFPIEFEMISKFEPPVVLADGVETFQKEVENDRIDPTLPSDRMIYNKVNSLLGITMERKILAWSNPLHDNYMIYEYTFVNTGNTDDDEEIELPGNTVNDVIFFWQYRYSMTRQTRYLIGNASGWGINTMHDARGDGESNIQQYGDPEDERFRAQFAWHGFYADKAVTYDNIGAPIWRQDPVSPNYIAEYDTVGRLGAPQFGGIVTIHADKSVDDKTDDPGQPFTTTTVGSDEPLTSNNSAFDVAKMQDEYNWMTRGHSARHGWKVVPDGNFAEQDKTGNISPGEPGGFSFANGYGPYTMGPGDTIRIVMAEAVAGLSRKNATEIGIEYKAGNISDVEKNEAVITGRDSLFQTFRRAIANYQSGYDIANPPRPPQQLLVEGKGDKVTLSWTLYADPGDVRGYNVYRSRGRFDADPELLTPEPLDPSVTEFEDTSPVRGIGYFYYLEVLGQTIPADPDLGIPATQLKSSRLYTQTYDPVFLKRPAGSSETFGTDESTVRVVPNPFMIASSPNRLRFENEPNKLVFYNVPARCTIDIYTERGELVYSIEHTDGSGDEFWDGVTSSNQLVVSGIYLAVITDQSTGRREIKKFVVIR